MITVSEQERCVCVWGNLECADTDIVSEYQNKGYTIVRICNGVEDAKACLRTVIKTSGMI